MCQGVHRFYFLNKTGLQLDYTRRFSRARGSQRVRQGVSLRRGRALTLIRALGVGGLRGMQVLEGALTKRSFAFYLARVLAPELCRGGSYSTTCRCITWPAWSRNLPSAASSCGFCRSTLPTSPPSSKLKIKLREAQVRTQEALELALRISRSTGYQRRC